MAAAREILSTTLFQGDNRQGSRKRKQNMSARGQTNFTTAPAGAVGQTPTDSTPQAPIDLSVTIQAVASMFEYPEAFVLSCALDMKNAGRTVNTSTLVDECEQQFQGEATLQKYAGPVDLQFGASSSIVDYAFQSMLQYLPSQSSQPTNISSGPSTQNYYHSNNLRTKERELSRDRKSYSYKHGASLSAQYSCVADTEHSGEDNVDGGPLRPEAEHFGSSLRAQSSSGSLKDLVSSATALPYSPSAVSGSKVYNPESLNPPQPGTFSSDQTHVSDRTLTDLTDVMDRTTGHDVELESNSASAGRESVPAVNASSPSTAEIGQLCFELVENEQALLKKYLLCSLCSTRPRDMTFLPCGHFTSCRSCAEPTYVCPCCNRSIQATIDTVLIAHYRQP